MRRWDAVIFDLGGVVLDSPLAAFAQFEAERGLPHHLVNRLVVEGGRQGAWARFECGELGRAEFEVAFALEASARGVELDVADLMEALEAATDIRPGVFALIDELRGQGLKTAALTNNWASADQAAKVSRLRPLFDVVVESFRVRLRKPDPAIYSLVLEQLELPATRVVFVDDIGLNLKPARALGMHTIKAVNEADVVRALYEAFPG